MKKILFCFIVLFVSSSFAENFDESIYRKMLEKCDKTAKYDLEFGDLSTAGMTNSVYKQIDCYEVVANKIINKYYKKTSKEMKENLKTFLSATADATRNSHYPDICYPSCGTIVNNLTVATWLDYLRKYIDNLFFAIGRNYN